jgi:septal ring factor EnvC (AmiA/AmiB activator)
MFIFSSKDFHQAYLRIKYLQQYTEYRKEQATKITNITRKLGNKLRLLESQKNEKLNLLKNKEFEKQKLFGEKEEQNKNIQQLSQKEKVLLKTLRDHEQSVQRLQDAIERIIAEEVRRVNEIKRKNTNTSKGRTNPGKAENTKTEYVYSLTDEDIKLSSSFEKNKGKLPWPVDHGNISDFFGEQPHAELKGIMIKNNGINIETTSGSPAKSIFEGVVTGIITIPNFNYVVIIRHGEFLTVYSNLKTVSITKGDKVKTLQQIGIIHSDPNTNKTKIHFEIWKGKVLLNPSSWIRK